MKDFGYKKFLMFWSSQSISQLGSAMTSFALTIWVYKQTSSAMAVSLLTFFYYVPFIIVSLFSGNVVDNHTKEPIMLWSDTISCICTLSIWIILSSGRLVITYIYIVNFIIGCMNAFQSPAEAVAIGLLVPKDKYTKISGLNSFSGSLQTVIAPTLAASISSYLGLKGIILIDMLSFLFAFTILLVWIKIPEKRKFIEKDNKGLVSSCKEGLLYLKGRKGLWDLILSMALLNFLSRLTYENILPAMILARSAGNEKLLGVVSGILGMGGIVSSLFVSFKKLPKDNRKLIYISAALSFLFGDILMGLGKNVWVWCFAAIAASVPIPFINAGQNVILYHTIPTYMQGRIFAVRNAIQYSTIPLGILLGGFLADFIFEPFMMTDSSFSYFFHILVGSDAGSGMAVMFLLTGLIGFISSMLWYKNRNIKRMTDEIESFTR
jgi:MFS transporter, DHA3 family, macrolide efflux protein